MKEFRKVLDCVLISDLHVLRFCLYKKFINACYRVWIGLDCLLGVLEGMIWNITDLNVFRLCL